MRWLLLGMLLLALPAWADSPNDYAFAITIEAARPDGFYRVDLDERVYRNLARDDLRDLAVFDARGKELPSSLEAPTVATRKAETRTLALFPLPRESAGGGTAASVLIRRDATGRLIELADRSSEPQASPVYAYIIDASQIERPIQALLLSWKDGGTGIVRLRLEGSDDLNNWRDLGTASLGRVEHAGRTLERQRFEVSDAAKYYRLSWPERREPVLLDRIVGELAPLIAAPEFKWRALIPVAREDGFEFDSGGPFPDRRVRIELPEVAMSSIKLYSRAGPNMRWQLRYSGPIYDVRANGQRFDRSELELQRPPQRYWRIEVAGNQGTPTLKLGYLPHRLLFSARGPTPYRLAFGRANLPPQNVDRAAVLQTLQQQVQPVPVWLGRMSEAGGPQRLKAERPIPWRTWLVWATLIVGVGVLAWMAKHLVSELDQPKPDLKPDERN